MPKTKGRGSNPRSHHNKPKLGVVAKKITALPEDWETAEKLGGNCSEGFRIAMRSLRLAYPDTMHVPRKLVVLLMRLQKEVNDEQLKREVKIAIADIESWGIEEDYKEAIADGVIKVGDNWIV